MLVNFMMPAVFQLAESFKASKGVEKMSKVVKGVCTY